LIANHGLGIDGMVPYNMAIRLITSAMVDTEDVLLLTSRDMLKMRMVEEHV